MAGGVEVCLERHGTQISSNRLCCHLEKAYLHHGLASLSCFEGIYLYGYIALPLQLHSHQGLSLRFRKADPRWSASPLRVYS